MTIELVDFPIKHGDFPVRYVKLPEGMLYTYYPIYFPYKLPIGCQLFSHHLRVHLKLASFVPGQSAEAKRCL